MRILFSALAIWAGMAVAAHAQEKYQYAVDIANIQNDKVAVTLKTPVITQQNAVFSFPKAIPGSYARKDYGRFVSSFAAFSKDGKKLKTEKLGANQFRISNASELAKISYLVDDTWDTKHSDFIFQPGGSNIEAGTNVVMNNHAFYGYFEGLSNLPYEITVTKPAEFYGATHLDVTHTSTTQDVLTAKNYVYLADNPVIYARPDTVSFNAGNSQINVSVYSATGKVKAAQVAGYLKPLSAALTKFFNGLPVKSYQFLFYFEDPKKALTDRKGGEGGYGALEHNYSSLYYLPEVAFEKDLISMVHDVSGHEFLHILTPLNLHSNEIENFNFTEPVMSQHLWLYEGVTEYFAQLIQLQNGLITQKKFFEEMRNKINQAEEFGDFSMTEMSRRVMEDSFQKKYSSVYNRGALIALLLDVLIRERTEGTKDLKQVMLTLTQKYGPNKPFDDNQLFDDFVAASHPDVRQFIDKYIIGSQPLPYSEYFNRLGYDYQPSKDVAAFYPGKMGLKYEEANKAFVFTGVDKNPLGVKEGDTFLKIDDVVVSAETIDDIWDKYFNTNTDHPEISITVLRDGKQQVLQGKIFDGHFKLKNYLAPTATVSQTQQQMLNKLVGKS
ncbi:hypothetical protein [Mucilaginibacter sp. PAMB04168]|uniref:M61 family metallopeptidase n=1 Tax=Mucilaginibacter sp. PAMB04168 TaxID=3138567 RepID=UPI0031F6A067